VSVSIGAAAEIRIVFVAESGRKIQPRPNPVGSNSEIFKEDSNLPGYRSQVVISTTFSVVLSILRIDYFLF